MDMIVHEAISDQSQPVEGEVLCEQPEVKFAADISDEHDLAIIAALCDMVNPTGQNQACEARHADNVSRPASTFREIGEKVAFYELVVVKLPFQYPSLDLSVVR